MRYTERYLMALYYAYGRVDEARKTESLVHAVVAGANLDPPKFAEWYFAQCEEFARGDSSYLRSVQDSWKLWRQTQ